MTLTCIGVPVNTILFRAGRLIISCKSLSEALKQHQPTRTDMLYFNTPPPPPPHTHTHTHTPIQNKGYCSFAFLNMHVTLCNKHWIGIQMWFWWRCSSICVPRHTQSLQTLVSSATHGFSDTSRNSLSPPSVVAT